MLDKMKQFMEMKKQADKIKRDLDGIVVDVHDVPGIRIQITGSQVFQSVEIEETLLKPEQRGRLQKDLLRGLNAAVKKSQTTAAQRMAAVMPNIPGMNF